MSSTTTQTQPAVSLAKPVELWNTMPGWGIVTNLIPPELLAARKLRVVRRILLAALGAVALLLVATYVLSMHQHSVAQSDLADAQDRTTSLTASQNQYSAGVQVQSSIDSITKSLGALMTTDVDTATLFGELRAALPSDMTINRMSLSLNKNAMDSAGNSNPAAVVDTQPDAHIGTVTLSGGADSIVRVTQFVDRLSSVTGVVQAYPANVSQTDGKTTWSITLTVNSKWFTHQFDPTKNGGK